MPGGCPGVPALPAAPSPQLHPPVPGGIQGTSGERSSTSGRESIRVLGAASPREGVAEPRGSPSAERGKSRRWSCAEGPPRRHAQFLAAMTTDKATPPSAMAVAPKSHFQGMDCGAEHGDVRGCARGRGHVPSCLPCQPCLLDRASQKGSAGSALPGTWPARLQGQRVPPAAQLTALPNGQLGAKS